MFYLLFGNNFVNNVEELEQQNKVSKKLLFEIKKCHVRLSYTIPEIKKPKLMQ